MNAGATQWVRRFLWTSRNLHGVKIDPEVAGDVEMLQDMILAACNEAVKQVDAQIQQKMGGMLGGMGLPPGMF